MNPRKRLSRVSTGDRITQVTAWHHFTDSYGYVSFGSILRICLGTAAGAAMEFLNPTTGGSACLSYRENPYEELMMREKTFMVEGRSRAEDGEGLVFAIEVPYKGPSAEPADLTLVYRGSAERTLGALGKRPQRQELLPGESLTLMERRAGGDERDDDAYAATLLPRPRPSGGGRAQGTGHGAKGVPDFRWMDGNAPGGNVDRKGLYEKITSFA
ncbi:hypothetical protein DL764_009619 [Monosporascus ibericus]|uniref:Uncharacterized protein n=1 Tax=Monosporascus ibericus TaxID=155417 RepID=A0A4Q4SUJ2_9PEZI|nr:hypothetical protein DL764_009619 [Monosporascus ibericus]